MSLARVLSFAFSGIEPVPVEVQVQIASGLPAFLVVGLADKAVAESRERVRAALAGLGLSLPPKRVLVNLAPADIAKEGSHLDLPIALAVLAAMDVLPREELAGYAALGELSLDGRLLPWLGPPPLGPYDEPEPPAVAERGCPMCGRPMSEHEYGQVGQRVTVRCPARNDSV